MSECRCGRWDGTGPHPCHGFGYTCENEGTERMVSRPVSLAGMQMKVEVYITYACDSCWEAYLRDRKGYQEKQG